MRCAAVIDFFAVPTATLKLLRALVVLAHAEGSRTSKQPTSPVLAGPPSSVTRRCQRNATSDDRSATLAKRRPKCADTSPALFAIEHGKVRPGKDSAKRAFEGAEK